MESHMDIITQTTSEADKHFQSLSTLIALQGKFMEVVDSSLRKYNGILASIQEEQKLINASLKQIIGYKEDKDRQSTLLTHGQCIECSFTQLHYQSTLEIKQHKTCLCKLIQDCCICCLSGYETLLIDIPVISIYLPQPVFFYHEISNAKTLETNIISRSHDDNVSFLTTVGSIRNKAFSRFTYPRSDFSLNVTTIK